MRLPFSGEKIGSSFCESGALAIGGFEFSFVDCDSWFRGLSVLLQVEVNRGAGLCCFVVDSLTTLWCILHVRFNGGGSRVRVLNEKSFSTL